MRINSDLLIKIIYDIDDIYNFIGENETNQNVTRNVFIVEFQL